MQALVKVVKIKKRKKQLPHKKLGLYKAVSEDWWDHTVFYIK